LQHGDRFEEFGVVKKRALNSCFIIIPCFLCRKRGLDALENSVPKLLVLQFLHPEILQQLLAAHLVFLREILEIFPNAAETF
jgi:hypothetical protein